MGSSEMDGGVESGMEAVMRDGVVVANIVSKLRTARDRYAAAMVCRLWHDTVAWQASKLALRTLASLPQLVKPFKHIVSLDLSCIDEQLSDSDVEFCASSFRHLRWLSIGHPELFQAGLSDVGLIAFADLCESLEHLSLTGLSRIGDEGIRGFVNSSQGLRSLTLESCRNLSDDVLNVICDLPALVELQLKGTFSFTSSGLAKIGSGCRGLTKVCFDLGSIDIDPALKTLAEGCPNLQDVRLKFNMANLLGLVKCTSLRSLSIKTNQRVVLNLAIVEIANANKNLKEFVFVNVMAPLNDGAVMGVVLKCPKLESLRLEAANLSGAAVGCIVSCKSLRHLYLEHLKSTGEYLEEIGMCGTGLKSFALKYGKGLRDMTLQTLLDRNRGLEFLDLQYCNDLSPIGFSAIAACSKLKVLDLSYTNVDDVSLLTVACGVHNLQQLKLIKCKEVISMVAVGRFKTLETLDVDQCSFVCDKSLEDLALTCSRLTHLSLAFTRVTDKGLSYLGGCSLLRSIRVSYCRFVKGDGLVEIAKACGGLQHVTMSHRFRNSQTLRALKEQSCRVSLEMDDMALVPFGYNMPIAF